MTPLARTLQGALDASRRAYETTPHRCRSGCGERVLREAALCEACDEERRVVQDQHDRLVAMRIPSRLRWATFGAPELPVRVKYPGAIEQARAAAHAGIDRIVLQGRAGAGKSVLAVCILRQIAREVGRYCSAKFFDGYEIAVARTKSPLGAEAEGVAQAIRAEVLVFDEVGSGKITAHDATPDVVFRRHAEQRPTIYTTPFSVDEIAEKYGDGICRRIFERATVIRVGPERDGE